MALWLWGASWVWVLSLCSTVFQIVSMYSWPMIWPHLLRDGGLFHVKKLKGLASRRCSRAHVALIRSLVPVSLKKPRALLADVAYPHPQVIPIRMPTLAPPPPLSHAQLEHLEEEGPRRPYRTSLATLEAEETPRRGNRIRGGRCNTRSTFENIQMQHLQHMS
jgi:hypothetical protein